MEQGMKTPENDGISDEIFVIVKKHLRDTTRSIYDGGDDDYAERVRAEDSAFNHGLRVMESEMVAFVRSERKRILGKMQKKLGPCNGIFYAAGWNACLDLVRKLVEGE